MKKTDVKQYTNMTRKEKDALERKKAKKQTKTIVIILIIVAVIIAALIFCTSSNFARRTFTALLVGNEKFSAAEYNFFYYDTYYEMKSTVNSSYQDFASQLLPDESMTFDAQSYGGTGQTWADYLDDQTMTKLRKHVAVYEAAMEDGFKIDENDYKHKLGEFEMDAVSNGYTNISKYLKEFYDRGLKYEDFERCFKILYTARAYNEVHEVETSFTDDEINNEYLTNTADYDVYAYRYFIVLADLPEKADFADDEAYKKACADAAENARATAEKYQSGIQSEDDFIKAAKDWSNEKYADPDSTQTRLRGELIGSIYGEWITDSERSYGDTSVAYTNRGSYVLFYQARIPSDYETVNVRMIRLGVTVSDAMTDTEKETAKTDAENQAKMILDNWKNSGKNEAEFARLANSHSDDNVQDGLYENIGRYDFCDEIGDWCYDETRVAGDSTLIYSKPDTSYYIVLFSGKGDAYYSGLVTQKLATEAQASWLDKIVAATEVSSTRMFSITKNK